MSTSGLLMSQKRSGPRIYIKIYLTALEKEHLKETAQIMGFGSIGLFLKFLAKSPKTLTRMEKFIKIMKAWQEFEASLLD